MEHRRTDDHRGDSEAPLRDAPAPISIWQGLDISEETLDQMRNAARLPISVAGALMPDGHVGYGLPIGGVLATRGAVIPYGVGVDIACRVKLSIVAEPPSFLDTWRIQLRDAILSQTIFGAGGRFDPSRRRQHAVMDDPAWERLPAPLREMQHRAWEQLGTSGSGNHFVEWGDLTIASADDALGLAPGRYVALLSHSGSRGFGARTAEFFTRIASDVCPLPQAYRKLAWLGLDSEEGQAYWDAMELCGRYASANHELIHRHVLAAAGLEPAAQVENHHNFAWKETHGGEELVVHRKGATPAGRGVLGFIPGSMAAPGYIVRGLGEGSSLNSAAHGAGRRLGRKAALRTLTRDEMRSALSNAGVELISAGLDEAPQAYKDIEGVMSAQRDLVEAIATFRPRIVRMADDGTSED